MYSPIPEKMKICVIGLGYIGLPTASLLAAYGHDVTGVDINESVVEKLNRGEVHISEPDLNTVVRSAVNSGCLKAETSPVDADAYIIAVPTPFKENKAPDMRHVEDAAMAVAPYIKKGCVVILESTSPVGTTEELLAPLLERESGLAVGIDFHLAYCPERVLPGHILKELVDNDRIVGGLTDECAAAAASIYKSFVAGEIFLTDCRTAEMCKLVENAYRDVNIAFANELSMLCHNMGVDVGELIKLANRHPRVHILSPGAGVGGHCIAVDPWFIVHSEPETARLVRMAREVNDFKPKWIVDRMEELGISGVIACLGVTYKPDVDDLRESPSLWIARELGRRGCEVLVCEPNVASIPDVRLADLKTAIDKADTILLLVKHRAFKNMAIPDGKRFIDFSGIN